MWPLKAKGNRIFFEAKAAEKITEEIKNNYFSVRLLELGLVMLLGEHKNYSRDLSWVTVKNCDKKHTSFFLHDETSSLLFCSS